jgi:type I restriction enzyme M protein
MLNAETKRRINAARDVLVGVAPNPTTQIDQITYALIYKFMDDMDQAAITAGGEPSFFVEDLSPYAWTNLTSARLGNQEKMTLYAEALTKFAEAKQLPELFRSIFRAAFLPYRSPETLSLFIKEISYFDYTHPEDLGNAYEYLLSIMSSQGDAGQFRTPRHIIDFIVEVVNPSKSDKILDPACGTAGFLVSAYNHILEKQISEKNTAQREKPLTPDERKILMSNLEGYDIDPTMVRIAQVNMYLHQFKNPQIFQYDSLTNEERWSDKFDVILANPPFMTPKGGIKPHTRYGVKSNRSEVLFVDYILSHLRPKGRAGIIVPETVLFLTNSAYKEIRKMLIENGLYAVVSLPNGVFLPYSSVKTSILLFNNEINQSIHEICFVKINSDGFELIGTRKPTNQNDLPDAKALLADFLAGNEIDDSRILQIPKARIAEDGNYFLNIERYQEKSESSTSHSMATFGEIFSAKENEKVGNRDLPVMSITMAHGLIDQSEKFTRRIASVNIDTYKVVRQNELVVGFPIDEGVLGFLTNHEEAAVSPAYGIWKLNDPERFDVEYLELVLRSMQMRHIYKSNMQGAVGRRRTVPKDVFLKLEIPAPDIEIQRELVAKVHAEKEQKELAKKKIEVHEAEIQGLISSLWIG